MKNKSTLVLRYMAYIAFLVSAIILILYITIPINASPEYKYTIQVLSKFALTPCLLFFIFFFKKYGLIKLKGFWNIIFILLAIVCLVAPQLCPRTIFLSWEYGYILSCCWIINFLFLGILSFRALSIFKNIIFSCIFSILGSLFISFAFLEAVFLMTDQTFDAIVDDTHNSKYVLSNKALGKWDNFEESNIGTFPKALGYPVSVAQRFLKFDDVMFDVCYTFDKNGHRIAPEANALPLGEVLLFGCSYAFGHGLNDEDTLAWRLGKYLGSDWRVTNYAMAGWGPHQTLTLLEENMVIPPVSQTRVAFFWAIKHQLRRNAGLLETPATIRYTYDKCGNIIRNGLTTDTPYQVLVDLPKLFNGSQLVSNVCMMFIENIATRLQPQFIPEYLGIIEEISKILKEKFNVPLIVLLWPDIEFLEEDFNKRKISTISLRKWIPMLEKDKKRYIIHDFDIHPNQQAMMEISEKLAKYIKEIYNYK